jgi:hypothetical protein
MRKAKKGGDPYDDEPDEENQKGDIEEAGIKASKTLEPAPQETPASSDEYDELDAGERGEHSAVGGTRKHRRKRCGKSRRTRKKRRSRRRH